MRLDLDPSTTQDAPLDPLSLSAASTPSTGFDLLTETRRLDAARLGKAYREHNSDSDPEMEVLADTELMNAGSEAEAGVDGV